MPKYQNSLTVVIPFRDEEADFKRCLKTHSPLINLSNQGVIKLLWINDNSRDRSEQIMTSWYQDQSLNPPIIHQAKGEGLGLALKSVKSLVSTDLLCVLPLDCELSKEALDSILKLPNTFIYGALPKLYSPAGGVLSFYSKIQNLVLLEKMKIIAWTNVFVLRLSEIDREMWNFQGFLDDLNLSKTLKDRHSEGFQKLPNFVKVSSRRYQQDKTMKRILVNGIILGLWLIKTKNGPGMYEFYKNPGIKTFYSVFRS